MPWVFQYQRQVDPGGWLPLLVCPNITVSAAIAVAIHWTSKTGIVCGRANGVVAGINGRAVQQQAGIKSVNVAIPTDPAVAGDAHILHRPVSEPPSPNPRVRQAVDVESAQMDIRRVLRVKKG